MIYHLRFFHTHCLKHTVFLKKSPELNEKLTFLISEKNDASLPFYFANPPCKQTHKPKEADRSHFTAAQQQQLPSIGFSVVSRISCRLLHCSCRRGSRGAAVRACHSEQIKVGCFKKGMLLPFCLLYRKQIRPPSCISLYVMEFFHSSHTLRQTVCASLGSDAQSLELCQSEFSRNKSRKSLRESGRGSGEVTAVNY